MIAYLEGTILHRAEDSCILLTTGGVGYHLHLNTRGLAALPDVGQPTQLFIYTLVREDALTLYAFTAWDERQTFVTLLAAPKLGPRTALAMLGCYTPGELATCVAREDVAALTRVPGIGGKTAKRLLLDLKDKLGAPGAAVLDHARPTVSAVSDCTAALLSLGYARQDVDEVVRTVFEKEPDLDAGSAIRQSLKIFAAK